MMKKIISLFLFTFYSMHLYAGSAGSGVLYNFHFMNNGVVIVYTTGTRTGVPSCATNQPLRFAVDATTAGGKVQLSGLLSAHAAQKPVVITGRGQCDAYGDTETISYVYIP